MNKKIHFFQSIHFKIALSFVLLLLVTLEIIGAYFVQRLEQQNVETFKSSLQIPEYVKAQIGNELNNSNTKLSNREIKRIILDINNSGEIQVIDNTGTIRGSNNANDQGVVGHKTTNAMVKDAIYNNHDSERISYTANQGSIYSSILPIANSTSSNTSAIGAIYIRANMEQVYRNLNNITLIFLSASLVAGLLGTILAIVISRQITLPIDEMKKQAMRMAQGDYSGQVKIYGHDELGQLAVAVNNLSVRVEEAQEVSEAERRRLDSILAHMTDGVMATDRRGNVIIINETARDFLNETDEEVLGQSILKVLKLDSEFSLRDLLDKQQEFLIDTTDAEGHDLILHVDFSLIKRESGFISGLVCVMHDVTEQQKIDQDRREFVSNVSHELRTPLTSLRSYIEALNDGAWKDPEIAPQFLKVTGDETDRMIRMINDLLSLSRLDRGTAKIELEYVNMNELVTYTLNRFDMMLKTDNAHAAQDNNVSTQVTDQQDDDEHKRYTIKREFTKKDLWVEVDPDKMTQVIDNIMNNAIKYSPDGGVITVRLVESNNHVILSISDQGLGIPRKDLSHVFERFYRVDKARSRKQGGTGLGLAISKEVIEALHGKIWVDSQEGKGSTFYISLPYQPINAEEDNWDEV